MFRIFSKTLNRKIFGFVAMIVLFIVVFTWTTNNLLLERYFTNSNESILVDDFENISSYISDEPDWESISQSFDNMTRRKGLQLAIFDRYGVVYYSNWIETMNIGSQNVILSDISGMNEFINSRNTVPGGYLIEKAYNERLDTNFLELVGQCNNTYYALIRWPVENITRSVNLANRFLMFTGLVGITIAFIISQIISRKITSPIKELTEVAQSMSHFDFSRKMHIYGSDEVSILAGTFNTMSTQLEDNIRELQEKNKKLEEDLEYISNLDKYRKEFLSSVSHELKTPIALIQGYTEALSDGLITDPESKAEYYKVILDEADNMNRLVKKLLAINTLESGHDDITIEALDIASIIRQIVNTCKALPGGDKPVYEEDMPIECYALGDEYLIREVIQNYVTNAIHYCSGRNVIKTSIETIDEKIRVLVYNSGVTLNQEELERVWESFYKTDKSRCREYGGSGLGLTIVKTIMTRLNSGFGVYNADDGVVFWFELPKTDKPFINNGEDGLND